MATTKASTSERTLADLRKDDLIEGEDDVSGPKLAVIGAIALAVALVFLYSISPYSGIVLP
ncbi:hypothetical protein [Pendulispora albinea]|uniref:Uncharacterized protein n=1 Tax=Pendulispora albinea TaxID=2741071 RepID=A0ABZ2M2H9_9BACT